MFVVQIPEEVPLNDLVKDRLLTQNQVHRGISGWHVQCRVLRQIHHNGQQRRSNGYGRNEIGRETFELLVSKGGGLVGKIVTTGTFIIIVAVAVAVVGILLSWLLFVVLLAFLPAPIGVFLSRDVPVALPLQQLVG